MVFQNVIKKTLLFLTALLFKNLYSRPVTTPGPESGSLIY
jgi:hypothetical protein